MESTDLEMRLATKQDFDTLTDMCRSGFPEIMRWRAPKSHSRKWWQLLINSGYCEVWVCMNHDQVIGFIELDLDKTQSQYRHAWKRHRLSLFDMLYLLVVCPKLFITKTLQKLKKRSLKIRKKLKRLISKKSDFVMHNQLHKPVENGICSIRNIAVIPSMQGKGVSLKINKYCFQRARSLGYREVHSFVKRKNLMSKVMVTMLGFEIYKETDDGLFYKKSLETI
jgi:N-acetylglutamate synthase-like GNAT family acetyltransferase